MEMHLEGKTALVTGGSAGIGLACAKALVAEGVSVAIAGRSAERLAGARGALEEVAAARPVPAPRVVTIVADLSEADDVTRTAALARAALGRIDILINCAGSALGGPFFSLADEAFLNAWTLKLLGYIRMVRAVAPEMMERGDGRIVNIVGGAGRTPGPTFLSGSTANAALLNFTRGISRELATRNVRINAISPGTTATERAERTIVAEVAAGRTAEEARAARLERIPLRRLTEPDEIASMALLLVSDRTASMTGAEVLIDGGVAPGV
jgi:NAD(P)-dependent dehydrogenase (short-subunit alcohol dehydrogenase family)